MEWALYDPINGYYRKPFHPARHEGDYITGSTLHPAFADALATFIESTWIPGEPGMFVDVGCGSGVLLARLSERLTDRWKLYGIERRIPEQLPDRATCAGSIDELPPVRGIVFSYELFDALPVHRLCFRKGVWKEMYVVESREGIGMEENNPSTEVLTEYLDRFGVPGREGQLVEVCPEAGTLYGTMASRLKQGFIITFDYGKRAHILYNPDLFPEGTMMAHRDHHMHRDVLKDPGRQDLTCAVNFTMLEETGLRHGLVTSEWTTQSSFLLENGITGIMDEISNPEERDVVKSLFLGTMGQDLRVLIQERSDT